MPALMYSLELRALLLGAALGLLPNAFCYSIFTIGVISLALHTPLAKSWRVGYLLGLSWYGFLLRSVIINNSVLDGSAIILVAYLAIVPGLSFYIYKKFFPKPIFSAKVFVFPCLWVILEWIRTWFFTGYGGFLIGTLYIGTPLQGYAPVGGVHLVSLLALISAALVVQIINNKKRLNILLTIGLLLIWGIGAGFRTITFTAPINTPFTISLLDTIPKVIPKADLILLPKNNLQIFPISWLQISGNILFSQVYQINNNSYKGIRGIGANYFQYYKRHLTAFKEFLPFKGIFPLLYIKNLFQPGRFLQSPCILPNKVLIAPFLDQELSFAEEVKYFSAKANAIVNINTLSLPPPLQAQALLIARMRALELGKPIILFNNAGLKASVDSQGSIKLVSQKHPIQTIIPYRGTTPWAFWGTDLFLGLIIGILGLSIMRQLTS